MRRPLRSFLLLAALIPGLSGCSLLLDFDEEGQPCDDRNRCLSGYTCEDGTCTAGDGPATDAGVDAGTRVDAGTDAGTGTDAGG